MVCYKLWCNAYNVFFCVFDCNNSNNINPITKNKIKNINFNALLCRHLFSECGVFCATDHFFFSIVVTISTYADVNVALDLQSIVL